MEIVHERAAGIDISKRDAKVAVRKPGQRRGTYRTEVKTFGTTTAQIRELIGYLNAEKVSVIVMEATSDYWKPFYFLMEEEQLPVILVNAKRARNIPGRKTDVNDATWLAELAAHNLLAASFIPPEPIRHLRDLTRARSAVVHDRTKVYQRLEKFLESSKNQALQRCLQPDWGVLAAYARRSGGRGTRPASLGRPVDPFYAAQDP